jgi:hypothetical protein
MKRGFVFLAAGLCRAVLAFSLDFGVLLDQRVEVAQDDLTYVGGAGPWLSAGISEKTQFYFSGNVSFKYANDGAENGVNNGVNYEWIEPLPLLELSRLELDYRPVSHALLKAGRFVFSDSSGMIAAGVFDGLYGELQAALGRVSAGAWYSGLLFKETAKITMTGGDLVDYYTPWEWNEINNYFAPRRLLADLRWDIPGVFGPLNVLTLEGFAQFDLTDHEDTLNSQYLEIQYDCFPVSGLQITTGAIAEILEDGDGEYGVAFGGLVETGIRLPGLISHRFFLGANFSSGNWNETFTAFIPLSGNSAGIVFTPKMSSLARVYLEYKSRLHETLSLEAGARYFIRTDTESSGEIWGTTAAEDDAIFYGGEAYASVIWAPLDDITMTLGGGAFFPGSGNVFGSGADIGWKFMAGLILSF